MKKIAGVWIVLLVMLAGIAASMVPMGCKKHGDHPSNGDHPSKPDQPPKGDHPEHPK